MISIFDLILLVIYDILCIKQARIVLSTDSEFDELSESEKASSEDEEEEEKAAAVESEESEEESSEEESEEESSEEESSEEEEVVKKVSFHTKVSWSCLG